VPPNEMDLSEHTKQLEETYFDFRKDYLEFDEMFSREDLIFKPKIDPLNVFFRFEPSKPTKCLEPILDYVTGKFVDVKEVSNSLALLIPFTFLFCA
jgi:hypothetical protein